MKTLYNKKIADRILDMLSSGKTLVNIQKKGLPSRWSIYRWFIDNPDFERAFRLAQECNTDEMIETVLARIKSCKDTKMAKLLDVDFKATSWYISKINRRVYGEKLDVTVTTLDISPLLKLAIDRMSAVALPEPLKEAEISE